MVYLSAMKENSESGQKTSDYTLFFNHGKKNLELETLILRMGGEKVSGGSQWV